MNVMKQIKYLIFLIAAVIFSSCGSVQKSTTFRADDMRLNVGMNDLVYLGESEITVKYNVYLGCITVIDEVNGEDYSSLDVKKTSLGNEYTIRYSSALLVNSFVHRSQGCSSGQGGPALEGC